MLANVGTRARREILKRREIQKSSIVKGAALRFRNIYPARASHTPNFPSLLRSFFLSCHVALFLPLLPLDIPMAPGALKLGLLFPAYKDDASATYLPAGNQRLIGALREYPGYY